MGEFVRCRSGWRIGERKAAVEVAGSRRVGWRSDGGRAESMVSLAGFDSLVEWLGVRFVDNLGEACIPRWRWNTWALADKLAAVIEWVDR